MDKERRLAIEAHAERTLYYVQCSTVGNCVLWWARKGNGYTTDLNNAQIFTKKEILENNWRTTDLIWRADHITKNISSMVDHQNLNSHNRF